MSTEWKSQQADGKYSLQFETDSKENCKLMENVAQMIIDGKSADFAEVVRCRDCKHFKKENGGYCSFGSGLAVANEDGFCSYGKIEAR